jgi:ketosteroid isomerase-like protein
METKWALLATIIIGIIISGCGRDEGSKVEKGEIDIITYQFPEAQAEIKVVLDGIFKSIQDKDADKLISNHIYGPKFTEFRDSEQRTGSAENEQYERGFVGAISGFEYALDDLMINVFGEVSVVTFHADFRPVIGADTVQIHGQVTLIFVKTDDTWKITHEHFSPLNI